MTFDDDVDSARERLRSALADQSAKGVDTGALLEALMGKIKAKIVSRRLAFQMTDDEGDAAIDIVHIPTDEVLGFVYAEDGEYVFESNLEDYFEDFVDDDSDSFTLRLYETLRADLPKYEVEVG
ncbi:MAG: hypothetical protein ACOYJ6_03905 [Caulobacterales bacterium]|jgi:hypothetical protein